MKIGLGSAQFGMPYGVSNRSGRVPAEEVARIVERARSRGVRLIDTAPGYGEAERVLGDAGVRGFDVVTKTPSDSDADVMEASLRRSLVELRLDSVYGLLGHAFTDLSPTQGQALAERLSALKAEGLVARTGFSAYTGPQIDAVMEWFTPDIVQVPLNVFDRRLLDSGHLRRLRHAGVEVHVRSALLQGLLAMDPGEVPDGLGAVRPHLRAFRERAASLGVSPLRAALGFVVGLSDVDVVVCGVESVAQLDELCDAAEPLPQEALDGLAVDDEAIVDPRRWAVGG